MRLDESDARPAAGIVDPLMIPMRFVVGDDGDGGFGKFRKFGQKRHIRRQAVGDLEDERAGLEAAGRFAAVADRHDGNALGAQPLESLIERDGNPFDHDNDWRRAERGGTTCLIFDQSSASEREERAQAAPLILLVSPNQGTERHSSPTFPEPIRRSSRLREARLSSPLANMLSRFDKFGKLIGMTAFPHRAEPVSQPIEDTSREAVQEQAAVPVEEWVMPEAEPQPVGAGGRAVLGWALTALAALWIAYTGWSAGRDLASQPLTSPLIANWVAIATGPLALLGLAPMLVMLGGLAAGFGLRAGSLLFGWSFPKLPGDDAPPPST